MVIYKKYNYRVFKHTQMHVKCSKNALKFERSKGKMIPYWF